MLTTNLEERNSFDILKVMITKDRLTISQEINPNIYTKIV